MSPSRWPAPSARANEELYLVGGIVRDALLGRAMLADLDFATSAAPPRTRELLESAGAASVYLVGERFGTIGAIFGEEPDRLHVEVTTYRRETIPTKIGSLKSPSTPRSSMISPAATSR